MNSQFEFPMRGEDTVQIYALVDPRTLKIRYVGKAIDPQQRCRDHMKESELKGSCRRVTWLRKLKKMGLAPTVSILETVENSKWQEPERKWIAHFRKNGADLVNTLDGGEGIHRGFKPSPEAGKKIGDKLRGRKRSPEFIAKMSASKRGRPMHPQTRIKVMAGCARYWANRSPEEKERYRKKVQATYAQKSQREYTQDWHPGVSWFEQRKRWLAYIGVGGGRTKRIGSFERFEDAVAARKAAEIQYWGATSPTPEQPAAATIDA